MQQPPGMAATPVLGANPQMMHGPPMGAQPHPMSMPQAYTMGTGGLQPPPPGAAMMNAPSAGHAGSRPGSRPGSSSNRP